jgi:hypothetical protein
MFIGLGTCSSYHCECVVVDIREIRSLIGGPFVGEKPSEVMKGKRMTNDSHSHFVDAPVY